MTLPPDENERGPQAPTPRGRAHVKSPPQPPTAPTVHGDADDNPVLAKLWRLHERYGYFTRAELGEPAPRGCWECPGEFDANGRWQEHCGTGAA
jgi:hypothetical protein